MHTPVYDRSRPTVGLRRVLPFPVPFTGSSRRSTGVQAPHRCFRYATSFSTSVTP